MTLFKSGTFRLAGGGESNWKIDCDDLTDEDWATLAMMFMEILPPFGSVEGVPTGGLALEKALSRYIDPTSDTLLICDDVWTTGGSWEHQRGDRDAIGAVVFARNPPSADVAVIFPMMLFDPH